MSELAYENCYGVINNHIIGKSTVDNRNLALVYDPDSVYNKGDHCIHGMKYWVCNEDNTTGAWNPSKWTQTRVGDELASHTATITVPDAWCRDTSNNKINFFKNGKTVMMVIPSIKIAVAGTTTNIGTLPSDFRPPLNISFHLWNTNDRNASSINILQIFVQTVGTVSFYGSGDAGTSMNAGTTYVYMANN